MVRLVRQAGEQNRRRWSSAERSKWSRTTEESQRPQSNWRLPLEKHAFFKCRDHRPLLDMPPLDVTRCRDHIPRTSVSSSHAKLTGGRPWASLSGIWPVPRIGGSLYNGTGNRSEEHTSELQSHSFISY